MQTSQRYLSLLVIPFVAIAVACGGDGSASSGDQLRADVESAFNAVFSEDASPADFAAYLPEECQVDEAELALGLAFAQAFLGEIEIDFEITDVELLENDRAIVTMEFSGDLGDLFGSATGDDRSLWVLQGDRWRNTADCEAFNDEAEALGLSVTDDTADSFGGFGTDYGPPVPAAINQALEVGDVTVTITGVSTSEEPDEYGASPQGMWVIVSFSFANDGHEPVSPWWVLSMELFDDQDRTWDSEGLPFEEVGPGFSQDDLSVRWDVPRDAQGFRVVVSVDDFVEMEVPEDFAPYEVALPTP